MALKVIALNYYILCTMIVSTKEINHCIPLYLHYICTISEFTKKSLVHHRTTIQPKRGIFHQCTVTESTKLCKYWILLYSFVQQRRALVKSTIVYFRTIAQILELINNFSSVHFFSSVYCN